MELTEDDIQPQLTRRRPGQSKLTTPRDEKDQVTILSGTEHGKTLGTPIGLFVPNENVRPQDYSSMSTVPRPGHADYTYQQKYGTRASSGGGRASARETIGRVAAGAIAEKWLKTTQDISIVAWVSSVGTIQMSEDVQLTESWTRQDIDRIGTLRILRDPSISEDQYEEHFVSQSSDETTAAYQDIDGVCYSRSGKVVPTPENIKEWMGDDIIPVRCPHAPSAAAMSTVVRQVKQEKDSIGGTVTCVIQNVPVGLGEPCFDKLEALLAHAMMSLPATKGFEIGSGFSGAKLKGSVHNDKFVGGTKRGNTTLLHTETNYAGGTLGGISSGQPIVFRVAIKPVSTIGQLQQTANFDGQMTDLEAKGRHDPCVLPRAVPLVEAMSALVLADAMMLQNTRSVVMPRQGAANKKQRTAE